MKLTEEKKSELEYCAKDMIRMAEKILGMLEVDEVKKEVKEEEGSSKPDKAKIVAMFMKKK